MSKPTNKPGWNPTSNSTEPSSAKKAAGWSSGEKPSSAHFNWLMKTVSEWIEHIDAEGVKGPKGDTGPQGSQGLKGDTGATGPQGLQGEKGDTGPQGIQGLQGEKGDTGPQGLQGAKGDTGAAGAQGVKGDTGPQGATGASGSISSADLARISALEGVSGIVAASPVTVTFPYNGGAAPSEYTIGNSGSSIAVNWANGASQFVTLTADATVSVTGGTAGNTYYLRIQQGGYGLKRVVGWPTNIVWNGGSVPTISTAAWTVDVIGCYYDGTNYYGYVSQGYFTAPSVIDTKNGYISGGCTGGVSGGGSYVRTVEKLNFNSDTTLSTVQSGFGYIQNASGTLVDPSVGSISTLGLGTQSSTHGYHTYSAYSSLPSVNGNSTTAMSKLQFSNDTGAVSVVRPQQSVASWFSMGRRAVVQSNAAAYNHYDNLSFGKLTFSTDTTSSVVVSGAGGGTGYAIGFSGETSGVTWRGGSTIIGLKTSFSTDALSFTTYISAHSNNNGGYNEGVDGQYNGYSIVQTAATPTTTLYKTDKSTDTWTTLSSLSTSGAACSAVQGNTAGYFCGGQNTNGSPGVNVAGVSTIRKIAYSPETFSVHSASLAGVRLGGAGFEG